MSGGRARVGGRCTRRLGNCTRWLSATPAALSRLRPSLHCCRHTRSPRTAATTGLHSLCTANQLHPFATPSPCTHRRRGTGSWRRRWPPRWPAGASSGAAAWTKSPGPPPPRPRCARRRARCRGSAQSGWAAWRWTAAACATGRGWPPAGCPRCRRPPPPCTKERGFRKRQARSAVGSAASARQCAAAARQPRALPPAPSSQPPSQPPLPVAHLKKLE